MPRRLREVALLRGRRLTWGRSIRSRAHGAGGPCSPVDPAHRTSPRSRRIPPHRRRRGVATGTAVGPTPPATAGNPTYRRPRLRPQLLTPMGSSRPAARVSSEPVCGLGSCSAEGAWFRVVVVGVVRACLWPGVVRVRRKARGSRSLWWSVAHAGSGRRVHPARTLATRTGVHHGVGRGWSGSRSLSSRRDPCAGRLRGAEPGRFVAGRDVDCLADGGRSGRTCGWPGMAGLRSRWGPLHPVPPVVACVPGGGGTGRWSRRSRARRRPPRRSASPPRHRRGPRRPAAKPRRRPAPLRRRAAVPPGRWAGCRVARWPAVRVGSARPAGWRPGVRRRATVPPGRWAECPAAQRRAVRARPARPAGRRPGSTEPSGPSRSAAAARSARATVR